MKISIPILYIIYGFCFGLFFPILGTIFEYLFTSWNGFIDLHLNNPLMQIIDTAPIVLAFFSYLIGKREARIRQLIEVEKELKDSYARFYPQELANAMEKENVMNIKTEDEAIIKNLTLVFISIRNFTEIRNEIKNEKIFRFLQNYLNMITPLIQTNNGFIQSIEQEYVLAVFSYGANDALNASNDILQVLHQYELRISKDKAIRIELQLGIHTDDLLLASLSNQSHVSLNLLGDIAHYREAMVRIGIQFNSHCVISHSVYEKLTADAKQYTRILGMDDYSSDAMLYYENFSAYPMEKLQFLLKIKGAYEEAVEHYRIRKFYEASLSLALCLSIYPEDKASKYYASITAFMMKKLDDKNKIEKDLQKERDILGI